MPCKWYNDTNPYKLVRVEDCPDSTLLYKGLFPEPDRYCRKFDLYCKDANCPKKYALIIFNEPEIPTLDLRGLSEPKEDTIK